MKAFAKWDRRAFPPIVLGRGYFIVDMSSGGINFWRPLGCTERPLKSLADFEVELE